MVEYAREMLAAIGMRDAEDDDFIGLHALVPLLDLHGHAVSSTAEKINVFQKEMKRLTLA